MKDLRAPKTVVVAVRVNIELREAMQRAAVDAGTSLSAYIAATMAEATGKTRPARKVDAPAALVPAHTGIVTLSAPAALEELRRIGININQLTKTANTGVPLDMTHLAASLGRLLEALTEPEEFNRRLGLLKSGLAKPAVPALPHSREAAGIQRAIEVLNSNQPASPSNAAQAPAAPRRPSLIDRIGKLDDSARPTQSRLGRGLAALIGEPGEP